jgi:hypothetical protein
MSRRIRFIAIALALSALMAASVQAAPARTLSRESIPVVGSLASAWDWLVSLLQGKAPQGTPQVKNKTADDTSHLDPNGGNH